MDDDSGCQGRLSATDPNCQIKQPRDRRRYCRRCFVGARDWSKLEADSNDRSASSYPSRGWSQTDEANEASAVRGPWAESVRATDGGRFAREAHRRGERGRRWAGFRGGDRGGVPWWRCLSLNHASIAARPDSSSDRWLAAENCQLAAVLRSRDDLPSMHSPYPGRFSPRARSQGHAAHGVGRTVLAAPLRVQFALQP